MNLRILPQLYAALPRCADGALQLRMLFKRRSALPHCDCANGAHCRP